MPLERIERFSGPPLAERAWTCDQARATLVRRNDSEETLDLLVSRTARADGADPAAVSWDAWRRDDGSWAVVAAIPVGGRDRLATWIFDPRSRSIHADDAEAQSIGAPEKVVPLRNARSAVRKTVVVAREVIEIDEVEIVEQVEIAEQVELAEAPDVIVEESNVTEMTPPSEPETPKGKKGRRASVPSWDEILFGAGQADT